ncbi:MAG: YceI family protein [Pseudomonadota bacterium]
MALAVCASFGAAAALADHHEGFGVPSGNYVLEDTHGYITFSYSHLGFSTPHIGFDAFDVSLTADASKPEASNIAVTIDAKSINSRVAKFDEHLNADDFFDTAKYPEITFNSTAITRTGKDTFDITGDLTIKDTTKPVTLAATINKAANHPMRKVPTIGVNAEGKLMRSEWGLGKYAPAVGDEITLMVTAELIQAKR